MSPNIKRPTKSGKYSLGSALNKGPLRLALKIAGSALAIILLIAQIDVHAAVAVIGNIPLPTLAAAFIVFNISQWISSFRLNRFFRDIGVRLSGLLNLRLYYIGMFYNLLVPGGIGGDGFKGYLLHKKRHAGIRSLASAMIADRLCGLIAIMILSVALVFLAGMQEIPGYLTWSVFFLMVAGIVAYYFFFPAFRNSFIINLVLSLLVQGAQLAVIFILLPPASDPRTFGYMLIFLASSVATIIPVTIGGLGLRELVFLYGSRIFSLNEEIAVGTSLAFFLITLVSSLPGIILHNTLREEHWKSAADSVA